MIFDSLGVGEIGVVLALAVILIEPKKLGKVMRGFASFKRKVSRIQSDVKTQLDALVQEDEAAEGRMKLQDEKARMRAWGQDQVKALPAANRSDASLAIAKTLAAWPSYQSARVVSCFSGNLDELDTDPLLRQILADGKTLLMPFVKDMVQGTEGSTPAIGKTLGMAPVADLDRDLMEGAFRILEPLPDLRTGTPPEPDLVLIPGTCFDLRGGRLGKGLGFYDKYLAGRKALKVGLAYDVQITQKNLTLDPHDQLMDVLVSEKRLLALSHPRDPSWAGGGQDG